MNPKMWAELLNKTGTPVRLENCGNGARPSKPIAEGGCPYYHQYRTGGDIDNSYASWISNAQEVAQDWWCQAPAWRRKRSCCYG